MKEFFDVNKFFDWNRLIEPNPGGEWKFLLSAILVSGIMIALAIIRTILPGDQVIKHKIEKIFATIGSIGLVLTFFRWQNIPYLSARILWLALIVWAIIWLGTILYYRGAILPKKILQLKIQKRKEKYLKL